MKKFQIFATLLIVMLLVVGCGTDKYAPLDIVDGVDRCVVCNMLVPDDHNATQIRLKDGKALKFDDIGDLYMWKFEHGADKIAVQFVRDYHTEEWLKLEDAYFAYDPNFETPMAYGVYAFKNKADAEAFIAEQGTGILMTSQDLDHHTWEMNPDMMHHHDHDHDHDHHDDHNHDDHHDDDEKKDDSK